MNREELEQMFESAYQDGAVMATRPNSGYHKRTVEFADKVLKDTQAKVLEARIAELEQLIPSPVAEMASINYEDELKRLFEGVRERLATLQAERGEL